MLGFNEYEFVGIDADYARRLAGWCRDYLEELEYARDLKHSMFSRHYHDGICAGLRISLARVDHLEANVTPVSVRLISTLTGQPVIVYMYDGGDQK